MRQYRPPTFQERAKKEPLRNLFKRYLDREADLVLEKSITIRVRIVDIRENYGRMDFKCEPIMGTGSAWVTADRLAIVEDPQV